MIMKVKGHKKPNLIDATELEHGKLARVEEASLRNYDTSDWIGCIVIKSGERLVCIDTGEFWSFGENPLGVDIKVRVLNPDETVTLNNEKLIP